MIQRAGLLRLITVYRSVLALAAVLLLSCSLSIKNLPAQPESQDQSEAEDTYGSRFFDQLRSIFGRFRDADLQRVFSEANPIECSELVGRKGQWRAVAFFNEDRKLGDWCRQTLDEVKGDLAVYTFTGACNGRQGTLQVGTEFPTAAGIEAYNNSRAELNEVDVMVNDPVAAVFDDRTMALRFELPYLFLTSREASRNLYSLIAPNRDSSYATDVVSRWDCKAVVSKDVTYRFLICRVATAPRGNAAKRKNWEPSFGASAFFILSDGMEAQTSVNLTFGNGTSPAGHSPETAPAPTSPPRPTLKRPRENKYE